MVSAGTARRTSRILTDANTMLSALCLQMFIEVSIQVLGMVVIAAAFRESVVLQVMLCSHVYIIKRCHCTCCFLLDRGSLNCNASWENRGIHILAAIRKTLPHMGKCEAVCVTHWINYVKLWWTASWIVIRIRWYDYRVVNNIRDISLSSPSYITTRIYMSTSPHSLTMIPTPHSTLNS